MLFVLLKTSVTGQLILLGLALLAIVAVIVFVLKRRGKLDEVWPQENNDAGAEITEFTDVPSSVENIPIVQKVEYDYNPSVPVDFYTIDPDDRNRYINKRYPGFTVRFVQMPKKDHDCLQLYTSLPNQFLCPVDTNALRSAVPELATVENLDIHYLRLSKSPAVKWTDIENKILSFVFKHLHKVYTWKFEKQVVFVKEHHADSSVLNFNLKLETNYQLDLGRKLMNINGITWAFSSNSATGAPACMEHDNVYEFNLGKGKSFTWEELELKVKKVFIEHFPTGVRFTGKWETGGYVTDVPADTSEM